MVFCLQVIVLVIRHTQYNLYLYYNLYYRLRNCRVGWIRGTGNHWWHEMGIRSSGKAKRFLVCVVTCDRSG